MTTPPLSPTVDDRSSINDMGPATTSGAVLTRSRSSTNNSQSSVKSRTEKLPAKETEEQPSISATLGASQTPRTKSHSPTSGEVHILSTDLTCVGLSDENVENWGLKIVKLVAFPDLIPSCSSHISRSVMTTTKSPYSNDRADSQAQTPLFDTFSSLSSHILHEEPQTASDSSSSSSDDDGYFSHSPRGNHSTSSLVTSASRSYPDLTTPTTFKSSSKHVISTLSPLSTVNPTFKSAQSVPSSLSITTDDSTPSQLDTSKVPFFSFTRTPEGSSLTTDVSLLATLFPPLERHMVICSGELDAADNRNIQGIESSSDDEGDEDHLDAQGTLKCLQIDLRRFGLGKYMFHITLIERRGPSLLTGSLLFHPQISTAS